jgi:hypothetical protein
MEAQVIFVFLDENYSVMFVCMNMWIYTSTATEAFMENLRIKQRDSICRVKINLPFVGWKTVFKHFLTAIKFEGIPMILLICTNRQWRNFANETLSVLVFFKEGNNLTN